MPSSSMEENELSDLPLSSDDSGPDAGSSEEENTGQKEINPTDDLVVPDLQENEADRKAEELTPQQKSALAQEKAWFRKIVDGKAELEDAPKWLHSRLENLLNIDTKLPDIETLVEKKLQEKAETQQFENLKKTIPALTRNQAEELQARFKEFRPLGKVKALQTALEFMGLTEKYKEAETRGVHRARMTLPPSAQPHKVNKETLLDIARDQNKWKEFVRTQGRYV